MRDFRIIQTKPLTHMLPYQVEERRRVWYLPWPVWRSLKERAGERGSAFRANPRRFQSPIEARQCIERRQTKRVRQQAVQDLQQEEQRERRQLPRVVEVLHAPVAA